MKKYFFLLVAIASANIVLGQVEEAFSSMVKYRNIGPFRGGRSVAASGVVQDPLTYYMGTTGGGLWKTEDAGQHWNNVSDGFFNTGSVGAVAVSESHPNIIYVGMGEHAPRGVMTTYGDGVYKSLDGGKTWQHLGLEATQHISRIRIHPSNPDIVYVAAQGALHGPNPERGIYKTTDGGKNWVKQLFVNTLSGAAELSMDMQNPEVLYAAMWEHQRLPWQVVSGGPGSGLYKTTDGGAHWTELKEGLPAEKGKMAIAVSRANPSKVVALIESDSKQEKGGLFVSEDSGENWTRVSADHRLIQRAWYYTEVFLDPTDADTIYVMSATAYKSIDGGAHWEEMNPAHGDYHDLWIHPTNNKQMVLADDGGAAISFNGGLSWSSQNNMPTAQFYRVNADHLFPYNIYGGQQDNTSVRIASISLGNGGIGAESWEASAGGESAFLAFDPDQPDVVLGGSYLGTIDAYYPESKSSTNIMIDPIQYLGMAASEMTYRFNWNAPIIRSLHEPNTYFHGAQYVLKTTDIGQNWAVISPDLTMNDRSKQVHGGGPYTIEAVGAENYGTLSYIVESPHEKGLLYTGSDDGLVHITKDGGLSWINITPRGLPETIINAIEVSAHDPGTVYIATTRYKFNDKMPGLYKSVNYGARWEKISAGIPEGSFTRVVREDPVVKDLLFAGTEKGVYVSYNGGEFWEPMQLNLPNVPITDLLIKNNDLIVATQGRSFWVLDDLDLIRQATPAALNGIQFFTPEPAILGNWYSSMNGAEPKGTDVLQGVNPANGVVFYYHLPQGISNTDISLEIRDAKDQLIRRFGGLKDPAYKAYEGAPSPAPLMGVNKGLNRFVWDMKHPSLPGIPEAYIETSYSGHRALPGVYKAILRVGEVQKQVVVSLDNSPLEIVDEKALLEWDTFMTEGENTYREMAAMVNTLYPLQLTLEGLLGHDKISGNAALKLAVTEVLETAVSFDNDMIQRLSKAYDDVENYPNKFTASYLYVLNQTVGSLPKLNTGSVSRMAVLNKEWGLLKARGEHLKNDKIPQLNKLLWEAGIGAID